MEKDGHRDMYHMYQLYIFGVLTKCQVTCPKKYQKNPKEKWQNCDRICPLKALKGPHIITELQA